MVTETGASQLVEACTTQFSGASLKVDEYKRSLLSTFKLVPENCVSCLSCGEMVGCVKMCFHSSGCARPRAARTSSCQSRSYRRDP